MIDPPSLHSAALRFGVAVRVGVMDFRECHDILCSAAANAPIAQSITSDQFYGLCERLARTLAMSVDSPALAAAQHVRDAIRPLFARKAPRDLIELTAYRMAGDDLTAGELNAIVRDELTNHINARRSRHA